MLHAGVRAASGRWGVPCARGVHGDGGAGCGVRGHCGQRGRHSCGMPVILERRGHPGTITVLVQVALTRSLR